MKTLIFPFVGREAEAYARNAAERGEECIYLDSMPPIHHPNFTSFFMHFVRSDLVTHLFCPVASVYKFMETFPHGLVLLGESPIKRAMREHAELIERAKVLHKWCPEVSLADLAGVLKAAGNIYGESNDEKIAAMLGVFAYAPDGDVVEVGCLMGRSAFALRWCAIRYHHPFMLTVDPWSPVAGVQHDSPPLLKAMTEEWDWDTMAEAFAVNLAPLGHLNHLRLPSAQAFGEYAKDVAGKIAVLHIDGNHDYADVRYDIELWCSRLVPGGWLILDDYRWPHGDGPKRAGDELLEEGLHDECFEAGGALFVRFK